jgi:hypothetical protein
MEGRVVTTQLTFAGRTEISHLEVSELRGNAEEAICGLTIVVV